MQGELTKLNSILVSGASNARAAAYLRLDTYLLMEPWGLRCGSGAGLAAPVMLRCRYECRRTAPHFPAPAPPKLHPNCRTCREGAQHAPAVLGDVFEALLGALYLDQGFAAAQSFVRRVMAGCVDWGELKEAATDYKELLQ